MDDLCCRAPVPSGAFELPAHTSWILWELPGSGIAELSFTLVIHDDPGETVGLYVAPFSGQIDDTDFYFGIQTNVFNAETGPTGKGFIFEQWGTFDATDARAAPDGFSEIGDYEGNFIAVRYDYAWQARTYQLTVRRAEPSGASDWFDYYVTDLASDQQTYLGGLRFRRANAAVPATIRTSGTAFTEVYSEASDYARVPAWSVGVSALADGLPPLSARSEYPAFPYAEYPNTDVSFEPATSMVEMAFGGQTPRCHGAGPLF